MSTGFSYHDLYITTALTPRTSIFDLPFNVMVRCTRATGWQLWGKTQGDHQPELELIAGEYEGGDKGLRLDVNGVVIVDSLLPEVTRTNLLVESCDLDPNKIQLCRLGTHSAEEQAMVPPCDCPEGTCRLFNGGLRPTPKEQS
jgi:hypothetical protein